MTEVIFWRAAADFRPLVASLSRAKIIAFPNVRA